MIFTKKTPKQILKSSMKGVLNFQNLYSVYLFNNEEVYRKAISSPKNFTFPDGRILSFLLRTRQVRGPTFTRNFLQNQLNKKQKHFFILPKTEDLDQLIKKFPKLKNSKAYSPPYIQDISFPKKEVGKMARKIKQFNPDYVWVCIGNPKQEILANQLYKKHQCFYINVGAAIDFVLGKKKEAPSIFRKIGLEWFYRLITDFKYSKKKVFGSFLGLRYLKRIQIKNNKVSKMRL